MSNSSTFKEDEVDRYDAFDSLRSLAALVVMLSHGVPMLRFQTTNLPWPLSGAYDSRAAVVFFFILSGFVLHLSFSKTPLSFSSFAGFQVRRVFRIYPLFYFSLLAVMAVIYWHGRQAFPPFYDASQKVLGADHLDIRQWLQQIMLIGPGFDPCFANYPSWTLAVEMQVAILFPLFSWVVSRLSFRNGAAFICASFPILVIIARTCSYLGFFAMIPFFLVGAFFAQHRHAILSKEFSKWQLFTLGLVSWCLYGSRMKIPAWPTVYTYLCALGSLGLMIVALRSAGLARFLSCSSLTFLGKLSYGIYILHFPVLLCLSTLNLKGSPEKGLFLFLFALVLTIALSFLTHLFIEKPFIRLGRKLSAKLKRVTFQRPVETRGAILPQPGFNPEI